MKLRFDMLCPAAKFFIINKLNAALVVFIDNYFFFYLLAIEVFD